MIFTIERQWKEIYISKIVICQKSDQIYHMLTD